MSEINKNDETFTYTYSAKQQKEVAAIRKKYLPPQEDKMQQLRRLDAGATRKGTRAAIAAGTVSCLIMGTGMSCCMVWTDILLIPGVILGMIGIVGMVLSYPLYMRITEREREKIAPEILRLTDELMQ